jgi:hypothetical protein
MNGVDIDGDEAEQLATIAKCSGNIVSGGGGDMHFSRRGRWN